MFEIQSPETSPIQRFILKDLKDEINYQEFVGKQQLIYTFAKAYS
jgi:hypothetical protein